MAKHFSLFAILATACLVFSCNKPEEQKPEPKPEDPVLTVKASIEIEGKAAQYGISYEVENPVEGVSIKATCETDWIYDIKPAVGEILFNATTNLGKARVATMTVSYGDKCEESVSIAQKTFEFPSFAISANDITTRGAKITITPKNYKGNYFFEVFSKTSVEKFTSLDVNSVGDKGYGEALYKDDLAYLENLAKSNGLTLAQALSNLPSMYKVTSTGEVTEMAYSSLKPEVDYYAIAYGMDLEGNRTTEICLYLFTTAAPSAAAVSFTGSVSGVTQSGARVSITPSVDTETYYWTYASETDMAQHSLESIMSNMIANLKEYAKMYGMPISAFFSSGSTTEAISGLSMGTKYTIIAWGMDANGDATTEPQEVFSFSTKANDITDDCKFTVEFTEIEAMDVKAKVTPSNTSTKYYMAFIDEKRCTNYNDYQMVTRIINMENDRMKEDYYGEGITWDNLPGLLSGAQEVWGRRDLLWSFEPEHSYRVYVFGVDSNGNVTTEINRSNVTTVAPQASNVTFEAKYNKDSNWHIAHLDIVPSNDEDYYMPFLVKTEDLDMFRYKDGTLMERELMDKIRDVYEDEISQYVHRGKYTFVSTWTSGAKHSLILFGYAGSNTTPMYEFQFDSPAIPFGKANCDITYTYELFNGDDLADMAPSVWGGARGDCVMKVNIAVTGNPTNYYFGVWPPKENFSSTGGIDHLVTLCQNEATTGNNIINKSFGILKPWWNGAGSSEGIFVTDEGETLEMMPWSITAYAEDENYNYGPLHYEMFIPVQQPEANVTGKYKKGYKKAYDFWSSPASSSTNIKTMVFNVPQPETTK